MAKVLVTGNAGLIGAHFSRHLISKGHDVIGIDNLSGGYKDFVPPEVSFYKADLLDTRELSKIFAINSPDYVYHFAAYAAVGLSHFIRNFNYQNNVVASANLINECVKSNVKKIVFTSSMDVYGTGSPPFDETQAPSPEDPYGIAKFAVEQDLKSAYEHFGLKYSIVRPHNVFGIYQNIWDRYRNVIGIWIRKILDNEPITIYGDGTQVRSFSDVQYCMLPLEKLMKKHHGETFNIGSDNSVTINELSEVLRGVAEGFNYSAPTIHLEKRKEVHTAFCDHGKAKKILKFKDKTNLEDLVTRMFEWAVTQPKRRVHTLEYELEKGMYDYWRHS